MKRCPHRNTVSDTTPDSVFRCLRPSAVVRVPDSTGTGREKDLLRPRGSRASTPKRQWRLKVEGRPGPRSVPATRRWADAGLVFHSLTPLSTTSLNAHDASKVDDDGWNDNGKRHVHDYGPPISSQGRQLGHRNLISRHPYDLQRRHDTSHDHDKTRQPCSTNAVLNTDTNSTSTTTYSDASARQLGRGL